MISGKLSLRVSDRFPIWRMVLELSIAVVFTKNRLKRIVPQKALGSKLLGAS